MGRIQNQAARRTAPKWIADIAVGTSSTTAQNLSTYNGQILAFTATTGAIHVNCADSSVAAATVTMFKIKEGDTAEFLIAPGRNNFRFISDNASGNVAYADVGE